jgi:ABC-type glutathione transport system ATPase component
MLTLEDIHKSYATGIGRSKTVLKNLSFALTPGCITGLVGPSGCGKSTLGRLMLRLEKPDRGRLRFHGRDIWQLKGEEKRRFHRKVQMVPQHPDAAFNPRLKIKTSIMEVFRFHDLCVPAERAEYLAAALAHVSLHPDLLSRYPAQLSGGEIQRLAIARAILTKPDLLVLDEVTSMLDVSVQAAIIRTLQQLHREHGTAYLFITHNLSVARVFCHRIFVLGDEELQEDAEQPAIGAVRRIEKQGVYTPVSSPV